MTLVLSVIIAFGCSSDDKDSDTAGSGFSKPCSVDQPFPYPDGIPYVGVHANRSNNDYVPCETASGFRMKWHALKGLAMPQPPTFSPEGTVVYATTSNTDPAGCRLHALSTRDGSVVWCKNYPQSIMASSAEVDEDGNLYFTAATSVYSLSPDGDERWSARAVTDGIETAPVDPVGLHFTPDGYIATVTSRGALMLLDRSDGAILASLDLPAEYGFVGSAAMGGPVSGGEMLPEPVAEDLALLSDGQGADLSLGTFLGASGGFSDNTVGISSRNEIYIIGGGPDTEHGALIKVTVGGSPGAPVLVPGWYMVTDGGSATSPSITEDGNYVSVGDGVSLSAMLSATEGAGSLKIADVDACDANTDGDNNPMICAPVQSVALMRAPIMGSPPLLPGGLLYFWEVAMNFALFDEDDRDLAAYSLNGQEWEAALPDGLEWTSVMTVSENHIIGTVSRVEMSDQTLFGLTFVARAQHYLAIVDRGNGHLLFAHEISDDATSTVAIGPDGSLYAAILGLVNILAIDSVPTLGLVSFEPVR